VGVSGRDGRLPSTDQQQQPNAYSAFPYGAQSRHEGLRFSPGLKPPQGGQSQAVNSSATAPETCLAGKGSGESKRMLPFFRLKLDIDIQEIPKQNGK